MKIVNKICEASSNGEFCFNKARFKIIDIECKPISTPFWVCNNCIKYFVIQKEDNPHYIILQELK